MVSSFRFLIFVLAAICWTLPAFADSFVQFDRDEVFVCEVSDLRALPPDPLSAQCERRNETEINLHRRTVWIIGDVTPSPALLSDSQPIGLFLAAKAASRVYLNGKLLAENGEPAFDRETEQPGSLDFVFHVPASNLRAGPNRVAVLMSGHHSHNGATRSLLTLGFFTFQDAPYHERGSAILAVLMLGVFLVAAVYASVMARLGINRPETLALAGTSVFASIQVVAETLRSFWLYPYDVHDLRLLVIILCGLGVGLTLVGHTVYRFRHDRPRAILTGTFFITLLGVLSVSGFDAKAAIAILLPSLVAALVALIGPGPIDRRRLIYIAVFLIFAGTNILDPGFFLDTAYFAILAAIICILSAFQAVAFVNAIRENERGDHVRRRLEHLLAKKADLPPAPLVVRHSGRMERFPIDDIAALVAAGDYVDLQLVSGRSVLIKTSLAALQKELPDNFLKVHRSYIVNADKIISLTHRPHGTGELSLSTNAKIPVSRRILPKLRKSLSAE